MTERLIQRQLFEAEGQDVTPTGFSHLPEVKRPGEVGPRLAPGPAPELGRHVYEVRNGMKIRSPGMVANYLMTEVFAPFEDILQEEMWTLLLDQRNVVRYKSMIYRGTVNSAQVRAAEIFLPAVHTNSPFVILAHNHPSSDPDPSPEDIQTTQKIIEAGKLLNIGVLDHLIIGNGGYVSLSERGVDFII